MKTINFNETALGIELGSTRIKAVLIDKNFSPVASGEYVWENRFENGIWTYPLEDADKGVRACYAALKADVREKTGEELCRVGAIGVSGMMHGYLPFDSEGKLLVPFRTWRNTITADAARELTEMFDFNIPQRWSIAHLYRAIKNGEEHVQKIDYLTTLAGYIHMRLTGERVVGVGEASGMFPIDSDTCDYDEAGMAKFDAAVKMPRTLKSILPRVLKAGEIGGFLTKEGALFLDPTGALESRIPVAPCEGDAGTGMVATNSVREATGNVSAGTSDFAMIVASGKMGVHKEIDMVTTPTGRPVAMVHCNNCTSDINAWVELFAQSCALMGMKVEKGDLFTKLFEAALEGAPDCGGLVAYNYLSGESITGFDEGRAVFARAQNADFSLANFMRTHLMSAIATLKIGLDILTRTENVKIDKLYGHGGFFKTPGVGQLLLSAAVGTPVCVMETAGEGGPYGMAVLASYMIWKKSGESLEDFLDKKVFKNAKTSTLCADEHSRRGFDEFLKKYTDALPLERMATEVI